MGPITDEERPHIEAMQRATAAGFEAVQNPLCPGLYYERRRGAVVDTYSVHTMDAATAARFRTIDYFEEGTADPLWHKAGTVEEVVEAVLALPPDGAHGAPSRAVRTPSGLVLPPSFWLPNGTW